MGEVVNAESLTKALGGRWHGSYGTARCPAHEDKTPSLSAMWWRQRRLGHTLPAEFGLIQLDGRAK